MYENIKNIYQHAGKCDDQQKLKDIIDHTMVSNPEGVTDNSTNVPMTSKPVKESSARKSLSLFTNKLDFNPKTEKCCIVAEKSTHRTMKVSTS